MLDANEINALVTGDHGDPFACLGMHADERSALQVRTFQPDASAVAVIESASGKILAQLAMIHPAGLFAGPIARRRKPFAYRLRVRWGDNDVDIEDPYRFPPILGELDVWLLAEGTHYRPYERLGAHLRELDGVQGASFAVWAPNARRVSVVGDFNHRDARRHPMRMRKESGEW